ncbi:MAG: hypothetical protein AAF707_01570 [Pseudomonadota bacterium]
MIEPEHLEALRASVAKVKRSAEFHPDDRMWWFDLRSAATKMLELKRRDEFIELRQALRPLSDFPENKPNEAKNWHALLHQIELVIADHG